jgi:Cu(I)/Ag(I) efflux system membrane fusion protein
MRFFKSIALIVLLGVAFGGGYLVRSRKPTPDAQGRKVLYWVDPMHPAYKSDKPGIAPDCGMKLEPVYADEPAAAPASPGKVLYYRDPQNHDYKADKPGLNPETGHTLEPVYAGATGTMTPGTIRISVERQQLIGVRFATAELDETTQAIRTVGTVTYDETRVAHVHPRIEGWVEKVFVDFTGDVVRKGEPMVTIYSPEMLASQQELLLAARARDLMASNPMASAAQSGDSLFQATRRRLELWDLSPDQIDRVLKTGQPIRNITLNAPASGYVLQRNVFPNQKVTPDSDLYTLADLSRVWILADVFESDIPSIKMGAPAHLTFPSGAAPVAARVSYVQPQVDPATRTMKVRLEATNPGVRLKPDMFVNVEFALPGAKRLMVPADAVLDTGDRQTVFVDLGNGYFEPRPVVAGERAGDRIVIRSGLAAGERVVASGTFLVDSESQLKAAAAGMGAPQGGPAAPAAPAGKSSTETKPGPGAHRHD